MRKILLAAAITLIALPAWAVNLTITLGNKTRTITVTPQNAQRLVDWATAAYPDAPDPVLAAIDATFEGLKNNVIASERERAKSAIPDPAPVN